MSVHLVYPDKYEALLQDKVRVTEEAFVEFQPPMLEVHSSPASHFRMRAEFKIWLSGETASYAMYEPGKTKKFFTITEFPVASCTINNLMPKILEAVNASPLMRTRLFQAEFLTSTIGEAVVTLVYHRPLNDDWRLLAEALGQELGVSIIGRSKKQKIVVGKDHVNEVFRVKGTTFRYRQVEAAFSQPNAAICEKMLNWAADVAGSLTGDLLELYCGNGNFTLPLASRFNRVLATEISKSSVNTALANLDANNIGNVQLVRMSSEELTQAINGVREFRRLQEINLQEYNFTTLFVDPPRAGLDETTLALAKNYENIIYISCNPQTLHRDLTSLSATHVIKRFALFDQFPYTDHRECGLLLSKR